MNGYHITFFTQQDRRHGDKPITQWLVQLVQEMGLRGATVIPAAEGVDHLHKFHSAHFFELADQPLCVLMALTGEETDRLFERLNAEHIQLFYTKTAVEFGVIGQDSSIQK